MDICSSNDSTIDANKYPNLYKASKMTKTASNQTDINKQIMKKLTTRAELHITRAESPEGLKLILSPPFNAVDKITDNVYLTGAGGMTRENIVGLRISCIINATYEVPNHDVKGLECIRVPIDDTPDDDISPYLEEVADKLNEVVSKNRRAIVYCVAGISRSSALVLAYLVKYQKLTLKEAFIHCRKCRELSQPNVGFFKSLVRFERRMLGKTSVQIVIKEINGQNKEMPDIYEQHFPEMVYSAALEPRDPYNSNSSLNSNLSSNSNHKPIPNSLVDNSEDICSFLQYLCCPPIHVIPRLISTVAFCPPLTATYDFVYDNQRQKYILTLNEDALTMNGNFLYRNHTVFLRRLHTFDAYFVETRRGNRVACLFRHAKYNTKLTIIYSHNNAVDLGYSAGIVWRLSRRVGANVIAYDYTGYGLSSGHPYEEHLYADIDSVMSSLMYLYDIQPEDVILFGESIGSVPTIDLATRLPVRAVILDGPIVSGLRTILPVTRLLAFDPFPNLLKVENIECKVLLFHGIDDKLVNIEDALLLLNRCPRRVDPFLAVGCGHNHVKYHPQYYKRIRKFLYEELDIV